MSTVCTTIDATIIQAVISSYYAAKQFSNFPTNYYAIDKTYNSTDFKSYKNSFIFAFLTTVIATIDSAIHAAFRLSIFFSIGTTVSNSNRTTFISANFTAKCSTNFSAIRTAL